MIKKRLIKGGFIVLMAALLLTGLSLAGCSTPDDGITGNGIKPVVEKTLTGIEVTPPTKVQYDLGEDLDTTGMVVTATYSDGSKAAVTDYEVSGYDKDDTGNQTITVTYQGKTDTFTVNVIDPTLPTAATPTANPPAGSYDTAQSVTLTTTTEGAKIYYTIDGTEPTEESTLYSAAISFSKTTTIKAFAVKEGWNDSSILTAAYALQVSTPTISPEAGTYNKSQLNSVTLSATTAGAKIYYTTDGTDPTEDSTLYSLPFSISTTTVIKAIAVKEGMDNSEILTAAYIIPIEMASIPAGTFTMGSPAGEKGRNANETQHQVFISAFKMGKTEVTQEEYLAVMGTNPSGFNGSTGQEPAGGEVQGNRPVEQVRWYDAIAFCNKLSMKEGLEPVYSINGNTDPALWGDIPTANDATWNAAVMDKSKNGYRLPTEAEWEYACRAGTTTAFNNGIDDHENSASIGEVAWFGNTTGNSAGKTHEVGLKTPNAWGLYDMHGNVFEWCWDLFGNYYTSSPSANPLGASSGTNRILRGGSYDRVGENLRTARRGNYLPEGSSKSFGFRLARSVGADPSLPTAATPVASPAAGSYNAAQSVTLTTTTPDAKIYYTLDGTNPPISSILYTDPITIAASATLKAVAVKEGMNDSAILTAAYTIPIEMVTISGGTFTMGSPDTEAGRETNEGPQHQVTLNSFSMGKYQVTQAQYMSVMGNNPSYFHGGEGREPVDGETQGNRPVENVIWYDALVFCNKLSMAEGLSPAYSINGSTDPAVWGTVPAANNAIWNAVTIVDGSTGYRLPTEAQWEYACRAGTTTAFNTGAASTDDTGWFDTNSGTKTHQTGLKPANAWGLYDMHGNVWEWCWDWQGAYTSDAQTNPTGALSGTNRLFRGGGWSATAVRSRSAYRRVSGPTERYNSVGFRIARPIIAPVTFSGVSANGSASPAQMTTRLTLTFSDPVIGLSVDDITLSGVADISKGTLSGSNPYTLPVSGFTASGTLTVAVAKAGYYTISGSPKTAAIYWAPIVPAYIITGSGAAFTATKGGATIGTADQPIQTVINAIKTDTATDPATVQFGDGTTALDIGTASASFNNTDGAWGELTLTGKITGSANITAGTGVIVIADNVSVTSTADIANTVNDNKGWAVLHNSSGTLAISGGTVSANTGIAVNSKSAGAITVSGTATKVTSANITATFTDGTIRLSEGGTLEIAGGTVENTGSTNAIAVSINTTGSLTISGGTVQVTQAASTNYAVKGSSSGTITISGGEIKGPNNSYAVARNGTGSLTVSGGTISVAGAGRGVVNNNAAGTITISGGTISMTGSGDAVINNDTTGTSTITISGGTVQVASGRAVNNQYTGTVNISGGTVSATSASGYAVNNQSTGKITVSGTAKVTSAITNPSLGTINIDGSGTLEITGGTVENTANNTQARAIYTNGASTTPATVTISGGTVQAAGGMAVYAGSADKITVSGTATKITSAHTHQDGGTIYISNATSTAERLVISGGTVENTANSADARAVYNGGSATVTISGGTIQAATGRAVHNQSVGKITVSGTATKITSANVTAAAGTIVLANAAGTEERLLISGGTVENTGTNGRVIYNASPAAVTVSGGTVQATGSGTVYSVYSGHATTPGALSMNFTTAPTAVVVGNTYPPLFTAAPALTITPGNGTITYAWADSTPAADNFDVYWKAGNLTVTELKASGTKITGAASGGSISGLTGGTTYSVVITANKRTSANIDTSDSWVLAAKPNTPLYTVTNSGSDFTAVKTGGTTVSTNASIKTVINAIRADTGGAACVIQFGDGSAVLDTGNGSAASIVFDNATGATWSTVELSGKITAYIAMGTTGVIGTGNDPVSVISIADITNTAASNSYAVYNQPNTGTITISGGTVQAGTYAVYNRFGGTINISGGALSTTQSSSNTVHNDGAGRVNISGGTISNTATGNGNAVYNGSTGTIIISGGTISKAGTGGNAINNASTGTVTITKPPAVIVGNVLGVPGYTP